MSVLQRRVRVRNDPGSGETLQCPYCSRTFRFGQEISKPTRIEIPMGLSGSRRSAATGESIAPQSTPVVQGGSVKRSNFVRTHSRTACETESGWLHDHLAIVFGIGGAVIVGLMVAVIVLLLRGDNDRVTVARNSESVEALHQEKVEAEAQVVKESPVVTNNILPRLHHPLLSSACCHPVVSGVGFSPHAAPCGHFALLVRSTFGLRGCPPNRRSAPHLRRITRPTLRFAQFSPIQRAFPHFHILIFPY